MALNPAQELGLLYRGVAYQVAQLAREYEARRWMGSAAVTTRQLHGIEQAVRRLDAGLAAWIRQNITELYLGTIPEALADLRLGGVRITTPGFTGHDRRAMRALEERYSRELGSLRDAIGVGLVTGDRRQARERIERALDQEGRLSATPDGQLTVVTPAGMLWQPDVYAEMLGRTAMASTRRVAFRERYLQNGVDVVRVVPNGTVCPICGRWEGRLLSLTGTTPGIPTYDDARADGMFHPNCAHRYVMATGVEQPEVLPRGALVLPPAPPLPTLGLNARTVGMRPNLPPFPNVPPPRG